MTFCHLYPGNTTSTISDFFFFSICAFKAWQWKELICKQGTFINTKLSNSKMKSRLGRKKLHQKCFLCYTYSYMCMVQCLQHAHLYRCVCQWTSVGKIRTERNTWLQGYYFQPLSILCVQHNTTLDKSSNHQCLITKRSSGFRSPC